MPLSDTGLVCRYYLDEAASGTAPTSVLDSSPNAYHLTDVDYGSGNMVYTEVSGQRGLASSATTGTQRARRTVNNTSDALRDAIGGTQTATIEVVLSLADSSDSESRILSITDRAGGRGELTLTHDGNATATAATGGSGAWKIEWDAALREGFAEATTARAVYHVVFDSTIADGGAQQRVKLYKDGSLQASSQIAAIAQNNFLGLGSNLDLILLNRESTGTFDRTIDGVLYYAALYDVAFDATRVSDHATILLADDDTPASGTEIAIPAGALAFAGLAPSLTEGMSNDARIVIRRA